MVKTGVCFAKRDRPGFVFDDDGSVYFTSTADLSENGVNKSGTQMCRIDIETGEKRQKAGLFIMGAAAVTLRRRIFLKDGWYYLMQAEGGTDTGHMETIARARDVWGALYALPS